jgi:O-antigen biosynthesis protein
LPEQYRFSRAIILFGAILAFILIGVLRWALIQTNVLNSKKDKEEKSNTVIVGSTQEFEETRLLLKDAGAQQRILGRLAVHENDADTIGYWKKMKQIALTVPFKEVVFCQGILTFKDIVDGIRQLPYPIAAKIHAGGSSSIVGSDSKDTSGEAVSKENGFKLADPYNRRLKRLLDVCIAFFSLLTFPLHFFLVKKPFLFFSNCFAVLLAKKTWIGYATMEKNLPGLSTGVIACNGVPVSATQQLPGESLQMMDYWYARDYEPASDLKLLWRAYRRLGG